MLLSAIIAEDHDITREGLRSLVSNQMDARVAATTGDGLDVAPLVREHEPDLLILDLGLPHLNGLDILRKIRKTDRAMRVVVLSMHGEDSYVQDALRLGAEAYVLKGSPLEELTTAIRSVMRGETYLGSDLSDELIKASPESPQDSDMLTDREREILQLTAEGYTSREAGEKLHISHRTVEKHRENIKEKLDLRNAVEMATYAHKHHPPMGVSPAA